MYSADTILKLKTPRSTEDTPFPYDRVRVIGPSPVSKGHESKTKYAGSEAQGVIITPLEGFEANLDEPFGKLTALYDVESVPERKPIKSGIVVKDSTSTTDMGPTPEQVFAAEAPGEPSEHGERVRTPLSPLTDPNDETAEGPLGDAPEEEVAPEPVVEKEESPL
jgi:hypothetical protein